MAEEQQKTNSKPVFFLLSGPPGAGKSTTGMDVAPPEVKEILDFDGLRFDEIGKLMNTYKGNITLQEADQEAISHAGSYMDDKIEAALNSKTSFGVEDMIWGEQAWTGAKNIQEAGYEFQLTYIGLDGADLSAKRVADRVEDGGHDFVSPEEAKECYHGNLKMLDENYQQPDRLEIYDNSDAEMKFVVSFNKGQIDQVAPGEAPEWVWASLPNIHEKIERHNEALELKTEQPGRENAQEEKKAADQNSDKTQNTNLKPKNRGPRL